MKNLSAIAQNLFEKLRNQFSEVSLGGENAQHTSNPEEARFFNFSFTTDAADYGNITVSIADGKSVKVYFTRNISSNMPLADRKQWYAFLKDMRFFALRNFLTFDPRDITRDQLTARDLANSTTIHSKKFSVTDVAESKMYGSSRRSYQRVGEARILVKHSTAIDPEIRGSRARKIESIFIETAEGERFKLPFVALSGARAMANHIGHGGMINDRIGRYITGVVSEMSSLRGFVRNARNCVMEDETATGIIEAAIDYYGELHEHLHNLKGSRTYKKFTSTFTPLSDLSNQSRDETISEYFANTALNNYLESALPAIGRAKKRRESEAAPLASKEFEQWLNSLVEGQDSTAIDVAELNELLSKPIPFGVGASNVISLLGPVISNDQLNHRLTNTLAGDGGLTDQSDARPCFYIWMQENMPEIASAIEFDEEEPDTAASEPEKTEETIDRYDLQGSFIDSVEAEQSKDLEQSGLSPINQLAKLAGVKK